MTIKITQCERLIFGPVVWTEDGSKLFVFGAAVCKEDVPGLPISDGLSATSVFVSLMSAVSVFVSTKHLLLP